MNRVPGSPFLSNFVLVRGRALGQTGSLMKTPSGTSIVIVLGLITAVSIVLFQACANQPGKLLEDKRITLKIGKDDTDFVEIKHGAENAFNAALIDILNSHGIVDIHYKSSDKATVDPHYHPPSKVSLKTDKVTTSEIAQNEPLGDPSVTQKVASNDPAQIAKVLDQLSP